MHINWTGLGEVFLVALGAVLAVMVLFAVGLRGVSQRLTARERGASGATGLTAAVLCFAACAAIVGYGIHMIVG
ncbi:hypothetical protein F0L68_40845 [Solihabitans fulvus]|uniref:Uncharacterized protein n=1 Tax=Solihabitans fulvus TaxID=1892852 RepID=A0A5B2W4K8_9PSEU|nr:hypothetical protein [Solihabitans fulvus]KAA2246074.1 hypothetical protein F0L68_40845 [Solihabitans fulvus]